MYSLQRTLSLRYGLTMLVALSVMALIVLVGIDGVFPGPHRVVLLRLVATAVAGAGISAAGAWWLTGASLAPVREVAAQARAMMPSGRGTRQITVHADVVELQDLIATLNGLLARLDAAIQQQRRIIADVGHDLRTPITAIRGEVEIALRLGRTPAEYQALLGSVLEEVDHLALMGDALIALARLESEGVAIERAPADLAALVRERVRRFTGSPRPEVSMLPMAGAEPLLVSVDARMVGMALDQLLENALRYTLPGTAIWVALILGATTARLVVEDAGKGVPEEQLPQLFEPLFRPDTARALRGAGLGLTLVRSVALAHGGSVSADRSPRGGLRVTLELPLDADPGSADAPIPG